MATTARELHEQHQARLRELGNRHARIKQLDPDEDAASFESQYGELVACAAQLLEFERALPARLAEPQRERTEQIVKWSWRGESAVAVALMVAMVVLGHTIWWLVLLIPHLLATLAGWSVTVTAVRHRKQRAVAIGLHALCLLVGLVTLGVLSPWWITAILLAWLAIGVASEGTTQQGAK
ncbi:hypothetical protein FE633_12755 [Streptomyces montanus]|uniref:Uncharacterized protein n=1 Tax=Streptomyces montanus TaxID=2580423 RepID=A0A5R9FNZ5_9ACTN|nr:hypothetical protein [Streptomyces montanus]TLS45642.1 hypothetical protein FE633_12755 [Streptomyces montanus]